MRENFTKQNKRRDMQRLIGFKKNEFFIPYYCYAMVQGRMYLGLYFELFPTTTLSRH